MYAMPPVGSSAGTGSSLPSQARTRLHMQYTASQAMNMIDLYTGQSLTFRAPHHRAAMCTPFFQFFIAFQHTSLTVFLSGTQALVSITFNTSTGISGAPTSLGPCTGILKQREVFVASGAFMNLSVFAVFRGHGLMLFVNFSWGRLASVMW